MSNQEEGKLPAKEEGISKEFLHNEAIEMIKTDYDSEIPVDIWQLGLIYELKVTEDFDVDSLMTLTSPYCHVGESLPAEVAEKIQGIEGVKDVNLEMTFDPPWGMNMMSEEAKLTLGFM